MITESLKKRRFRATDGDRKLTFRVPGKFSLPGFQSNRLSSEDTQNLVCKWENRSLPVAARGSKRLHAQAPYTFGLNSPRRCDSNMVCYTWIPPIIFNFIAILFHPTKTNVIPLRYLGTKRPNTNSYCNYHTKEMIPHELAMDHRRLIYLPRVSHYIIILQFTASPRLIIYENTLWTAVEVA